MKVKVPLLPTHSLFILIMWGWPTNWCFYFVENANRTGRKPPCWWVDGRSIPDHYPPRASEIVPWPVTDLKAENNGLGKSELPRRTKLPLFIHHRIFMTLSVTERRVNLHGRLLLSGATDWTAFTCPDLNSSLVSTVTEIDTGRWMCRGTMNGTEQLELLGRALGRDNIYDRDWPTSVRSATSPEESFSVAKLSSISTESGIWMKLIRGSFNSGKSSLICFFSHAHGNHGVQVSANFTRSFN